MFLEMNQTDIDRGESGNRFLCPLAQCIRRTTNADVVSVEGDMIRIEDEFYSHTKKTKAFMDKVDGGEKVEPISFRLRRKK